MENPLLELHKELCQKANNLMAKKNHDYTVGSTDPFENFRSSANFGVEPEIGLMIRMMDKMKRVQTFVTKGDLEVLDESVEDTIVDLINYPILLAGLLRERRARMDALRQSVKELSRMSMDDCATENDETVADSPPAEKLPVMSETIPETPVSYPAGFVAPEE